MQVKPKMTNREQYVEAIKLQANFHARLWTLLEEQSNLGERMRDSIEGQINWGKVGDLAQANKYLLLAVHSLGGADRPDQKFEELREQMGIEV